MGSERLINRLVEVEGKLKDFQIAWNDLKHYFDGGDQHIRCPSVIERMNDWEKQFNLVEDKDEKHSRAG